MGSPMDELLDSVFQLAYFIHGHRDTAAHITREAMPKLEAVLSAQDKRRYYSATARTKVSMSELHLLQRITYIVSEPYERKQEQTGSTPRLDEDDMIIRFIKHLIQITVKRNSFYVTLGLSRLLHTYTTPETTAIYDVVTQDPDRLKDDYYYRECKKKLMHEIEKRFGHLIKIDRGTRGETRFQAQDNPDQHVDLIKDCLSTFTPWKTPCVIPDRFDPLRDELDPLSFGGDRPDAEHPIEINRIHSVLHPDCFSRLIRALKLDPPEERLAVPQFFLAKGHDDEPRPPRNRRSLVKLSEEERMSIRNALAEEAVRRKTVSAGFLSIVVDGLERARLDLIRERRAQFDVEEGAELIEVRADDEDGGLLLAANLLTYDDQAAGDQTTTSSVVLEGGQRISFAVALSRNDAGMISGAQVEIAYQETDPVRAASLLWRRLKYRIAEMLGVPGLGGWPGLRPALALLVVVVGLAGFVLYLQSRQERTDQPLIGSQPPPTVDPSSPPIHQPPPQPDQTRTPEVAVNPSSNTNEPILRQSAEEAARSLLAVKHIYVYSLGNDPFSQQVRENLISRLGASGRFAVTEKVEDADAALKGSTRQKTTQVDETTGQQVGVGQATVRLVNADGQVIWRSAQKGPRGKYRGPAADVAAQVVDELLDAIQRIERRPKELR